jgi:hypothetical protein
MMIIFYDTMIIFSQFKPFVGVFYTGK